MPLACTYSIALVGVEGHIVEVEADIANGLVGLLLVGLPDTALREARDRIRSAIVNSGLEWPHRKITVGLSPASLPKRGSAFDLAIAVAILGAAGAVPAAALAGLVLLGELGLDGRLRPVRGILPATASASGAGFATMAVPRVNASEAALMPGVRVLAVPTLAGLLTYLRGDRCAAGSEPVEVIEGGMFRTPADGPARGVHAEVAAAGPTAPGRAEPLQPTTSRKRGSERGRRGASRTSKRDTGDRHEPGPVEFWGRRRPGRRAWPACRAACRRDLRGRWPSPVDARAAGSGQDDAGRAAPGHPSPS